MLHFIVHGRRGAQRLAEASGVSLRKLGRVVRHTDAITGGAGSIMLRPTTAPLPPDDDLYDILCHTRDLGEKDLTSPWNWRTNWAWTCLRPHRPRPLRPRPRTSWRHRWMNAASAGWR